ncbi:MAG: rhodanese-like domain-containing protein [Kiritimatiellaeota bacterium]|nr:rhodanese-like domain-containing protein [Kiritimatiellota bacterium]
MKTLIAVLAVALCVSVVQAADYPDVTVPELKAAIAAKSVTLLDANGTKSWQDGHIPGAINFATSKDNLAELLPSDKGALIVAYCGGPKCMAFKDAAAAAVKLGYTNVKHLPAGISGWKHAGEAVEKGK